MPGDGHSKPSGDLRRGEVRDRQLQVDRDYIGEVQEAVFGVTPRGIAVVA